MTKKTTSNQKTAAKDTMASKKRINGRPAASKAEDYFIGETMEDGMIIGISKGVGRYYFMTKEKDRITILQMASKCKTYPSCARSIPEKNMDELFYQFKMFKENR